VRLGLLIFCRKIVFNNRQILKAQGPLLLACNHPNSFFDALLLGAFFRQPVHFLARGDAFKNPVLRKLLSALKAIPIYRLKEGKEYLALNDNTFERCLKVLTEGGIVLIFSEGLCLNQWQLRQLKKGTARIAISAWSNQAIEKTFSVMPVNLNYSSFTRFSKTVLINFGGPVVKQHLDISKTEAEQIVAFNKLLYTKLEAGMLIEKESESLVPFILANVEIKTSAKHDIIQPLKNIHHKFGQEFIVNRFDVLIGSKKIALSNLTFVLNTILVVILLIPAFVALLLHLPIYLPLNYFVKQKTNGTVFYHSALFGGLIIFYLIYIIMLSIIATIVSGNFSFMAGILAMPLLALIYLQWKDCGESVYNFFLLKHTERKRIISIFKTEAAI
jgi:1-acyl-sn-glycerol-3-phosphate acyltransferase